MPNKKIDILFTIMAMQEIEFFLPIARRLEQQDNKVAGFVTFHEAADDILKKEKFVYFSLHKLKDALVVTDIISYKQIEKKLGISSSAVIFHQMHTMNLKDKQGLLQKLEQYYAVFEKIFAENSIGVVVQELGGFIAPQLFFAVARSHKVDHIFIEPAMFPKRVVFSLNDLYSRIQDTHGTTESEPVELKELLDNYRRNKAVVIPKKDRHFFADMTLKRLFSVDNFRRLRRKIVHKYVQRRREEYNAILWYVAYHIMKWWRRKVLRYYYSHPVKDEKYIYFPFHVPLDVQLTLRCPQFYNQEALVEKIARSVPLGYKLYIKEHPAAIGAHALSLLRGLLKIKQIRLIHPAYNSFDLIKDSGCVVTINSKVGFEAIMQAKPVVVLGNTFYRGQKVTFDVDSLAQLKSFIAMALDTPVNKAACDDFVRRAFNWSYAGELYENSPENLDKFYNSLEEFLQGMYV